MKEKLYKTDKSVFKHAEINNEITNTEPDMFVLQQGKREWQELTYPKPDWNQLWQTLPFFLAYTCAGEAPGLVFIKKKVCHSLETKKKQP